MSSVPIDSSKLCICWDIADWVMPRTLPAAVMLPCSATTTKISSACSRSMSGSSVFAIVTFDAVGSAVARPIRPVERVRDADACAGGAGPSPP